MKKLLSCFLVMGAVSFSNASEIDLTVSSINLLDVPKDLRSAIKVPVKDPYNNIKNNQGSIYSSDSKDKEQLNDYFTELAKSYNNDFDNPQVIKEYQALIDEGNKKPLVQEINNLLAASTSDIDFIKKINQKIKDSNDLDEKNFLILYSYSIQIMIQQYQKNLAANGIASPMSWWSGIKCALGSVGGAIGGTLGGAAAGSAVPVIGTLAGGIVGGIGGAATGAAASCG